MYTPVPILVFKTKKNSPPLVVHKSNYSIHYPLDSRSSVDPVKSSHRTLFFFSTPGNWTRDIKRAKHQSKCHTQLWLVPLYHGCCSRAQRMYRTLTASREMLSTICRARRILTSSIAYLCPKRDVMGVLVTTGFHRRTIPSALPVTRTWSSRSRWKQCTPWGRREVNVHAFKLKRNSGFLLSPLVTTLSNQV